MAYRNDVEALHARHAALDAEIVERTRVRDDVARMLAEARALEASNAYLDDLAIGGPEHRRRCRVVKGVLAVLLAIVSIVGLLGVRASYRSAKRRANNEAMYLRFSIFTEQICACKDRACATEVESELVAFSSQMARDAPPPYEELTELEMKRYAEVGQRLAKCMEATLTGAGHVEE